MSQGRKGTQTRLSRRERRATRAQTAKGRRRVWAWASVGVVSVALLGLALGLHFAAADQSSGPRVGSPPAPPPVGHPAPDGTFTAPSGTTESVASLRGQPTVLWFVTTWCSSCQAGTQLLAQNIATLHADGVRVAEVELYRDLGQSGPSIGSFARTFAGAQATNPDWAWGTSSASLTRTYDPAGDLEIYYLLNAKGAVAYVNSPLVSTMPRLLQEAKAIG